MKHDLIKIYPNEFLKTYIIQNSDYRDKWIQISEEECHIILEDNIMKYFSPEGHIGFISEHDRMRFIVKHKCKVRKHLDSIMFREDLPRILNPSLQSIYKLRKI